jgi:hypothetical protein
MFNITLFSLLAVGYYEELPVANFDNSSAVVIIKKSTPLRRRVYVEVPVVRVEPDANIVKTTKIETTVVGNSKIRELVTERPIFPRINSAVRSLVTPKRAEVSAIVVDENPKEIKFEKKVITSSKNNNFEETTETTTTFNSDMIVEQRRGLFGRTRFRIFR